MPAIATKTERAFKRFRKRVKQVEMGLGLEWFHETLVKLADDGFLVVDWLSAFELAAVAKYVVLFGASQSKKPWHDMAGVLNPYKDFWAAAESENPYESDNELLGTFILRFVYQQLPFVVFPERVQSLFVGARGLYLPDSAVASQFEKLTKVPLAAFFAIAEKLYALLRQHASATIDVLRAEFNISPADGAPSWLRQYCHSAVQPVMGPMRALKNTNVLCAAQLWLDIEIRRGDATRLVLISVSR